MNAKELISKLQDRGRLVTIQRTPAGIKTEQVMELVEEIGRQYTPLFTIDTDNFRAYTNAIKWLLADPTMEADHPNGNHTTPGDLSKGLLISGTTGTGKSLLLEILEALTTILRPSIKTYHKPTYTQGGETAGYQEVPLLWKTYRADTITDEYQAKGDLDRFKQPRVIAIQDIGTEPAETLYMGTRANVMRQILEHRADDKGLITLATTNLTPDQFAKLYGERVRSRLFSMFNFLYLGGRDRRLY